MRKLFALLFLILFAPQVCFASASRDFDGVDDVVTFSDANAMDTTSKLTISSWVYADNWTGEGANGISSIMKKGENYILRKDTIAAFGGTKLKLYWWDGTNTDCLLTDVPATGAWLHIAATVSGNVIANFYINGVSQTTTTDLNNSAGSRDLTDSLEVGNGGSTTESFNGRISYSHILTTVEGEVMINEMMWKPEMATGSLGFLGPMWGDATEIDLSATDNSGTVSGSTTSSDGPPVMFGGGLPL